MKTTIEIPEKLFREAKARAAMEGLSLREFFLRGLKLALQTDSAQTPRERVAFPIVRSKHGLARLTDEQVAAALNSDKDLL
jgi:hypothetical protein